MVDMCATQEHHLETILAGPILLSHPQQGKQRYFRVPSLKLFRKKKKKKRKVDSLGITLSSCCLSGS
jgi:hypothetical protein